jgi:hypothetical protein
MYLVTEMVRAATGRPRQYTGRLMGARIATSGFLGKWTSFMDDLHQLPTRFQAPQPKRAELDAIAGTAKDAIVVASLQAAVGAR